MIAFNAQAVVELDTMLVFGQHVTDAPNDKEQLAAKLNGFFYPFPNSAAIFMIGVMSANWP